MEEPNIIDTGYDKRIDFWKSLSIISFPGEEWRDIFGFEGIYKISYFGRVKSLVRPWRPEDRILKYKFTNTNYATITLVKDKIIYTRLVSVLVAGAFIPNPDGLPEVNHLNGRKYDNCVLNLQRTTHKKNVAHAFETGLNGHYGEGHSYSSLTNEAAKDIADSVLSIEELASKYGVTTAVIYNVKSGKSYSRVTGVEYNKKTNKLTPSIVKEIMSAGDKHSVLAEKYGIAKGTIAQIKVGLIYSSVTGIVYRKGKKRDTRNLGKPVIQYDKEMKEVARYRSLRDTAKMTGYNLTGLSSYLNGKMGEYYRGFIFKYT